MLYKFWLLPVLNFIHSQLQYSLTNFTLFILLLTLKCWVIESIMAWKRACGRAEWRSFLRYESTQLWPFNGDDIQIMPLATLILVIRSRGSKDSRPHSTSFHSDAQNSSNHHGITFYYRNGKYINFSHGVSKWKPHFEIFSSLFDI